MLTLVLVEPKLLPVGLKYLLELKMRMEVSRNNGPLFGDPMRRCVALAGMQEGTLAVGSNLLEVPKSHPTSIQPMSVEQPGAISMDVPDLVAPKMNASECPNYKSRSYLFRYPGDASVRTCPK